MGWRGAQAMLALIKKLESDKLIKIGAQREECFLL
jgi:hypothetical protein